MSKHVVVIGAGNIGSHFIPHLGRMMGVTRVTVIDRGKYGLENLPTQDIVPGDVNQPKAIAQARRLRRINPGLRIEAIPAALQEIPFGRLGGDVIVAGLDSRLARQRVNEAAWHLGVPWIDAGVMAAGLLVRVNVYIPGEDRPCLECAWDKKDYDGLDQVFPCERENEPPPTNAPSNLGALAAAIQAIECEKLLGGRLDLVAAGKQILVDALHHKYYLSSCRRNPNCLFPDHAVWTIEPLNRHPADVTPGELMADGAHRAGGIGSAAAETTLQVAGQRFVRNLLCPSCGRLRSVLRLRRALRPAELRCRGCGERMVIRGIDMADRVAIGSLSAVEGARSLQSMGVCSGDVIIITSSTGDVRRFEITVSRSEDVFLPGA